MPAAVAPSSVEAFVQQLLETESQDECRALIAHHELSPDAIHDIGERLLDQAVALFGVNPSCMERLCRDALAFAEAAGDPLLTAMAAMRLGDALRAQAFHAEACELYDDAAGRFTALGLPVLAARTRIGWTEAAVHLGRASEALAGAKRARRTLRAHGDPALLAMLDLHVGTVYFTQGLYPLALRSYAAAFAAASSAGETGRPTAAMARHNSGVALIRLGRYREALPKLEGARLAYEQMGRAVNLARAVRSQGEAHLALGHYSTALQAFEQAAAVFQRLDLGNRPEVLGLARDTAVCYLTLNRPVDALAVLVGRDVGGAASQNVQHAVAVVIHRVAAYLRLGRHDDVLAEFEIAERHLPDASLQDRAWLAVQQARALLGHGAAHDALAASRQAQGLARSTGARGLVADALLTQGAALLALGLTSQAARCASRAHRLARAIDAAPLLHQTHTLLGETAEANGRVTVAQKQYLAAVEQLEREQRGVVFDFREGFSETRGVVYERLARLQLQAGRPEAALLTAERAKSRALLDALMGLIDVEPRGRGDVRRLKRQLTRAREEYAAHCAHLSRDEQQVTAEDRARRAALEEQIERLRQRLQVAATAEPGGDLDLFGIAPVARLPELPNGAGLLEFFISGQDILRFAVDEGGVRGVLLSGALPEVERLLRAFRANLDATTRAERGDLPRLAAQALPLLQRLYRILFGGLDDLHRYRTLVVVPHGPLHYLPFHALHDGEHYLVERLAVTYAPSARLYELCRQPRLRQRGRPLVLACSAGGQLPLANAEAEAVSDLLGTVALQNAAATRTALQMDGRRASLIHVAAHGQFRADAPLFSSIALADGPLTTADIFTFKLSAGLVTLSACETGRAAIGRGDELAGLARAFLHAGVPALLVSQWRVDDADTAALMTRFYTAVREGAGKAEALRSAQLAAISREMRQNGAAHPFMWAAFQIVGDDRPVSW